MHLGAEAESRALAGATEQEQCLKLDPSTGIHRAGSNREMGGLILSAIELNLLSGEN